MLDAAREHLDMEVAFLGQFKDGQEVYRTVRGDGTSFGLLEGAALPRAATYCQAMLDGHIDHVVADSAAAPDVANLEVTAKSRIGRYVGVPVHLPDGRLYGALCGIGHGPDPTLSPRDGRFMEFLATIVEGELGREAQELDRHQTLLSTVRPLLSGRDLTMVFRPILDLSREVTVGYEALARFSTLPSRPPDAWCADAAEAGLGLELEMIAVGAALDSLEQVAANCYLTVNMAAETACSGALAEALARVDGTRVVVEITEHAAVNNYQELRGALAVLRAQHIRFAVDDSGSGVASLHHILELAPELIKLDISVTRGVDTCASRAALATALVSFGAMTGAAILAEGFETQAELDTMRRLGVKYGQGYLLGRPGPLPASAGHNHLVGCLITTSPPGGKVRQSVAS